MRNINNVIFPVLCILVMLSSCTQEEFVAEIGQPVFTAEIPFQNEDGFQVNAGDDLYYMFASHQELEEGMVHSGLFGKEEICEEGCNENFGIKLVSRSSEQTEIKKGAYDYYSIPKDGFKHNLSLESSDEQALEYTTWKVRDKNHVGQPSISFNSDNDSAPQESIQLVYDVPGQFIVQFDRPILPKNLDCQLDFSIVRDVNEGLFIELNTANPFTFVSWSNGHVGKKVKVDFETQSYSANVYDGTGCQTEVIVYIKSNNITKDYTLSLHQESYMFSTPDNAEQSVIVEYTDKEGNFFTSSIIGQILPFEFNVVDVENYENNELGQPTWKIQSTFDCILFGDNGTTKRIIDGKATFAVSY